MIWPVNDQRDTETMQGTAFFFFRRAFAGTVGRPGQFNGGDNAEIGTADDEIDTSSRHLIQASGFLATTQLGQLSYTDLSKDLHVGHGFA
jgi:hypothetical protein